MLMTLNHLTGMPVIRQGEQIGLVERAVADAQAKQLEGIILRRGLRAAKWIPLSGIEWVGSRCIAVGCEPMPLPPALPVQAAHVYLTGGGLAGQVADLLISSDSMRVVALEVCAGPWYRLLGRSSYAREYQVRQGMGQVLVGQLFSWAQMEQMLKEEGE